MSMLKYEEHLTSFQWHIGLVTVFLSVPSILMTIGDLSYVLLSFPWTSEFLAGHRGRTQQSTEVYI